MSNVIQPKALQAIAKAQNRVESYAEMMVDAEGKARVRAVAAELEQAGNDIEALVEVFDQMLARWWSNATQADKELGNRAMVVRAKYAGNAPWPKEPPLDEGLSDRRREAADRARRNRD